MYTNSAGIELIKKFEGFSPKPYTCAAGHLTIGYGHKINANEVIVDITKAQGEELLRFDIQRAENSVFRFIRVSLSHNHFDALVSFTFNLGAAALQRSTLRQKINREQFTDAGDEFIRWVHAGGKIMQGLLRRRKAERELFLS